MILLMVIVMAPVTAANAQKQLDELVGFREVNLTDHPTKIVEEEKIDESILEERAKRIDAYFAKRKMPLSGYGAQFVEVSSKCEIDWRLLPAIGVRESSGGKFQFNNNPFGWGSAKIKFKDFEEAIEKVSDHLCGMNPNTARYYKDRTTYERLWYYNGTVIPSYPKEVMDIMDMI